MGPFATAAARRLRSAHFLVAALFIAVPALAFYGVTSSEVMLTFNGIVEIEAERAPALEDLKAGGRLYAAARQKVEDQVQFLVGLFQSPSFVAQYQCATVARPGSGGRQRQRVGCPGTMGESMAYDIAFTDSKLIREGVVRLRYNFAGPAVFRKKWFPLGQTMRKVALKMPLSPDRFFNGEMGTEAGRRRCLHDSHYLSEGDFFYFWDPEMPGCSLRESAELLRIDGLLTKTEGPRTGRETKIRWPNFGKLYGDNGNGETMTISWFLGYADEDKIDPNHARVNERDDSYRDFLRFKRQLSAMGFKENAQESLNGFRLGDDGKLQMQRGKLKPGISFLQVWEKSGSWRGKRVNIKLRMLLSDTGHSSEDKTFHKSLRQALPESDVLIYMGHSGLGGNLALDMDALDGLQWNPEKYQVFLFNGCSGNAYFPRQYAAAKGKDKDGKMNLRVLSSSLPTYFHNAFNNQVAFLTPFAKLETPDWKTFVGSMDKSTPDAENVLYGVNGEGDDDWTPQQ
ncbi:MAG: hypothetical protein HY078_10520 [Elusimicrobia bacterium]|nr:hypothetical protein [Elusimicrobiota bacterium]